MRTLLRFCAVLPWNMESVWYEFSKSFSLCAGMSNSYSTFHTSISTQRNLLDWKRLMWLNWDSFGCSYWADGSFRLFAPGVVDKISFGHKPPYSIFPLHHQRQISLYMYRVSASSWGCRSLRLENGRFWSISKCSVSSFRCSCGNYTEWYIVFRLTRLVKTSA